MELREKVIRKIVKLDIKETYYAQQRNRASAKLRRLRKRRNICKLHKSIEKLDRYIKPLEQEYDYWRRKYNRMEKAVTRLHEFFKVWEDDDDFMKIWLKQWDYEKIIEEFFAGVISIRDELDDIEFKRETR